MTVYVEEDQKGKLQLKSKGYEIPQNEWKTLKGMSVKNVQKVDGKIMFTLK